MLRSTQPDIAIVPECSKSIVQTLQGFSGFWSGGDYVAKGLGVLWKDGWKLTRIGQPDAAESFDRWIVAFDVRGPENFTLIAIWSHNDKHGIRGYVGQIHRAFNAHPEWFTRGPVMVAGDFNSSGKWDVKCAPENHAKLVRFLSEHGLVSAYQREIQRQKAFIRKARVFDAKLVFLVSAFRQLTQDENFTNLLKAEGLLTMPKYLAEKAASQ